MRTSAASALSPDAKEFVPYVSNVTSVYSNENTMKSINSVVRPLMKISNQPSFVDMTTYTANPASAILQPSSLTNIHRYPMATGHTSQLIVLPTARSPASYYSSIPSVLQPYELSSVNVRTDPDQHSSLPSSVSCRRTDDQHHPIHSDQAQFQYRSEDFPTLPMQPSTDTQTTSSHTK
jgi:hypothetical protein